MMEVITSVLLWMMYVQKYRTRTTKLIFHTLFPNNVTKSLTLFKCDQTRTVCTGAFWKNQYLGFKEKEIHIYTHIS